jgi:hypothetical protein
MSRKMIEVVCLSLLAAMATAVPSLAAAGPTRATDITATHGFKEAALCSFQPGGKRLFEALERLSYKQALRTSREVGGLRLDVEGRRTSKGSIGGGSAEAASTVGTPTAAVLWHGLQVRSFAVGYDRPPEADAVSWREVRLRASPAQVRAMLGRLGLRVPPGGYHHIDDEGPCGGALTVNSKAGEAAIRCEWGC